MSIQAPAHETVRAPEDVVASSAVEESTMQSSTSKKPSLTYDGYPKPHLRGWIHACTAPLALAACIVLTVLAPGAGRTWACVAYLVSSLLLFANSGVYHISSGRWTRRVSVVLQSLSLIHI